MKESVLIFVYNADGNPWDASLDYLHKVLSPSTYACSLCQLTHHHFGMKKNWSAFLEALDYDREFYHKDEFLKKYPAFKHHALPAVFIRHDAALDLVLSKAELDAYPSLEALEKGLAHKLAAI